LAAGSREDPAADVAVVAGNGEDRKETKRSGEEKMIQRFHLNLVKKLPIIPTYHLYYLCIPPYTTGALVVVYN
jgi:hypothetical protein